MKAHSFITRFTGFIAAGVFFAADPAAGAFIPPSDNASYRRDQLPIDVETMKQLSQQLAILCATLNAEDPLSQRAAAQFLAVALSLDPVNRQAQDMLESFGKQQNPVMPTAVEIQLAKSRAWRTQSWLGSEEAGKDGKSLALCLGDVLAKVDPDHPTAAAFKSEQGLWTNWVAAPADFLKKDEPSIAPNPTAIAAALPDAKMNVPTEAKQRASFVLKTATVFTPLIIYKDASMDYDLRLAPVTMNHSTDQDHMEFRYHLQDVDENRIRQTLRSMNANTQPWLKKTFGDLPEGGIVVLSTPFKDGYSVKRNEDNLSAAALVLTHAALSGEEPAGVVIGIAEADGKLKLPKNGWELIRSLSAAPPTRVVLPSSAAELLPGLLTMDELSYFMKHDIFLAENIDELIAFSKKVPDAPMAAALSNFAVIREKATSSIGPFVANPIVRARLEGIASAMPQYASVKFLLMQSNGKRSSQLSDLVVAHEMRKALAPLRRVVDMHQEADGGRSMTSAIVQSAHESSRAILDPLDRLVPSSSREIYGQTIDLSNTARTLARAMKKVTDKNFDERVKGFHDKSLGESSRALRDGLPVIERRIGRILGEEEIIKERKDDRK